MRAIIKEDILAVIQKLLKAIQAHDHNEMVSLSNQTIHDASIFQEDDPLTLAVVVYALAKIYQRCCEKSITYPDVTSNLQKAYDALSADNLQTYRSSIKKVIQKVSQYDERLKQYIQEVIERAKVKKASKLHEHGISIARTAELLGLSQWELQSYIGQTVTEAPHDGVPVRKRLQTARELFQ